MADATLTKEQVRARLEGLLGSVNREISNLRDQNNRGININLGTIKTILESVDRQIIGNAKVKDLLLSEDETTRDEVQAMVDEQIANIQKAIREELTDVISLDANAATLQGELDTALEGNKTIKTVEAMRQAEKGEGEFKAADKADVDDKVKSLTAQHGYATLKETVSKPEEEFGKINTSFEDFNKQNKKIDKVKDNFLKYKVDGQKFDLQQLYNTASRKRLSKDGAESAKTILGNLAIFKDTELGNKTIKVDGADVKISELATKLSTLDVNVEGDRDKLTKVIRQLGNMRELDDVSNAKTEAKENEKKKLFKDIDDNPVANKFKKFPAEIKELIDTGELDKASDKITSILRKINELESQVGTRTAADILEELNSLKEKQKELLDRDRVNTEAGKVINGKSIDLRGIGIAEDHSAYELEQDLTTLDLTDAEKVGKVVEDLYGKINDEDKVNVGNALAIRKEDTTKKFGDLGFFGKVGSVLTLGIGHRIANMIRRRRDESNYKAALDAGVKAELRSTVVNDASQKQGDVRTRDDAKAEQTRYSEFDTRYKVNLRREIIQNAGSKTSAQLRSDAEKETRGEPEDEGIEFE